MSSGYGGDGLDGGASIHFHRALKLLRYAIEYLDMPFTLESLQEEVSDKRYGPSHIRRLVEMGFLEETETGAYSVSVQGYSYDDSREYYRLDENKNKKGENRWEESRHGGVKPTRDGDHEKEDE